MNPYIKTYRALREQTKGVVRSYRSDWRYDREILRLMEKGDAFIHHADKMGTSMVRLSGDGDLLRAYAQQFSMYYGDSQVFHYGQIGYAPMEISRAQAVELLLQAAESKRMKAMGY